MKTRIPGQPGSILLLAMTLALTLMPIAGHAAVKKTDNFWHGLYPRSYDYYVPDNVKPDAPLLLVFHGIYADSERLWADPANTQDLPALAEEKGFIVMWMESSKQLLGAGKAWNAGPCCAPAVSLMIDDVGYTLKAMARLKTRLPANVTVDDSRIYALGHSNGGAMVHRLALQKSEVFTAIVPVSFPVVDNKSWHIPASWVQTRKVPVLAMHATDDDTVPYYGGKWIPVSTNIFSSAQEGLRTWAARNECTGSPVTTTTVTGIGTYKTDLFSNCAQGVSVGLHTFASGKHRPWYPTVNGGLDVTRESWRFFSQYRK